MEHSLATLNERKEESTLSNWGVFLLFFIWPFAVLIYALINYREKWSKNIFWLYTIYFGFTFVIPNLAIAADASRYASELEVMAGSSFGLNILLSSYLTQGSGMLDIAQDLITFIVSRFTDDYRFLFAVFGIFMGYFLSRLIWFLIDRTSGKLDIYCSLVLICFSLVIGIWDIGGIRWNVAAVIFTYGVLQYLIDGKTKGLWIAASVLLVHWSFILALLVLLGYVLIRNRTFIYFVLFVVSFIIGEIDLEFTRTLFYNYAPELFLDSKGSYLNEDYIQKIEEIGSSLNWYIGGSYLALKWYIFAFTVLIYTWGLRKTKEHPQMINLFNFALLFYGVFNFLSSIPSMGRFILVGNLLMLACLFFYMTIIKINIPLFLRYLGVPVFLFFIIVRLRFGFDYIGVWSVFGSPIFIYFADNNIALIDIIKGVL